MILSMTRRLTLTLLACVIAAPSAAAMGKRP